MIDDPWWISSDSKEYTFKNPAPAPQTESITNDEPLWKDDGDAYDNNSGSNDSFNDYNYGSSAGSGSAWDRIRKENNK